MKNLIALFTVLFIMQSCALHTGTVNPEPQMNLVNTGKSVYLDMGEEIPDNFMVPAYAGVKKSNVTGWRSSLQNGFNNGFGPFFAIADHKSAGDYILKLSKTELRFIPVSVSSYYNVTALKTQISFKAELYNQAGNKIADCSDTVFSKKEIYRKGEQEEAVKNAVERMYEKIGNLLFNKQISGK